MSSNVSKKIDGLGFKARLCWIVRRNHTFDIDRNDEATTSY